VLILDYGYNDVVDVALKIQQSGIYLENERKIDIYFPPAHLDSDQSACLEMNFAVLTYFEVKLAYATAADNAYKDLLLFRSIESLGEKFRTWKSTITPSMTEGQTFVVVLHSEGTSLGTMAMIQSINLLMFPCIPTGICYVLLWEEQ